MESNRLVHRATMGSRMLQLNVQQRPLAANTLASRGTASAGKKIFCDLDPAPRRNVFRNLWQYFFSSSPRGFDDVIVRVRVRVRGFACR
jgi:hypothetical protein